MTTVQFSRSVVSNSLRPHEQQHARPPCPSLNSGSSPKLMSIESVMPSSHLMLYHPLLLLSSIFPSIRVFSNESALHMRWPKYWSFSFSISSFTYSFFNGFWSLQSLLFPVSVLAFSILVEICLFCQDFQVHLSM